jgi:hypothetical protein
MLPIQKAILKEVENEHMKVLLYKAVLRCLHDAINVAINETKGQEWPLCLFHAMQSAEEILNDE